MIHVYSCYIRGDTNSHCELNHEVMKICFFFNTLTCHQQDGLFLRMQLHLPGDPGPVEVGVPPAFLLAVGLFVLVARPDEGDAEKALLPVHRHFILPRWDGRGCVLLGCF